MGSTLNSYYIATTGLYVSQASLTVVSHNLSNVNTTGYSRQQISAAEQSIVTSSETATGSGVSVTEIARARNSFLDQTYRQQNAKAEYWDAKSSVLEDAQKLLDEYESSSGSTSSENGLQQTLQDFFDSWEQLTKEPDSQSTRSSVVESAGALVDTLNQINEQLTEMQQDACNRVKDGVDSINKLAEQVAKLNSQITQVEADGTAANDLRDQRDELIDQISAQANISVTQQASGVLDISIAGVSLVKGDKTQPLEAVENGSSVQVKWANLDMNADISSGSLKAYLEEADQSGFAAISDPSSFDFTTDSSSSLATLRQGLNDLMTTIADKVNSLLESGIDLDGNSGEALFVKTNTNQALALGNIQINSDISTDVDKIAAGTSGETGDATLATQISALQDEKDFSFQGLEMDQNSFYQALISWIGTTGDTASSNYDTQNTLLQQAETQRQSISSVSEDEEMSKMITYQNAYNASSRVLSTIDSLIGDLIDDLGSQ